MSAPGNGPPYPPPSSPLSDQAPPAETCPFCEPEKLADVEPFGSVAGIRVIAFPPLNPVTEGHMLVAPLAHVEDATKSYNAAAACMAIAAHIAGRHESANIITSIGAPATQTVRHLHVHVVPRREGDRLSLPWTDQARAETLERQVEQHKSALNVALAYAGGFRAPETRADELAGCQAVLDTDTGEVLHG